MNDSLYPIVRVRMNFLATLVHVSQIGSLLQSIALSDDESIDPSIYKPLFRPLVPMLTQSERFQFPTTEKTTLLQGVIESLLDGILILTSQGKQIYINDAARHICQRLNPGQATGVPREIWRACEALIESLSLYSNRSVVIESEIALSKSDLFRIRVRWLPLEDARHPHLVVLMEDCCQSLQSRAIAEIQQYGLTPRQAEVWVLHRIGYSYQDISKKLYISLNTVKKHIKDIHVKQQLATLATEHQQEF